MRCCATRTRASSRHSVASSGAASATTCAPPWTGAARQATHRQRTLCGHVQPRPVRRRLLQRCLGLGLLMAPPVGLRFEAQRCQENQGRFTSSLRITRIASHSDGRPASMPSPKRFSDFAHVLPATLSCNRRPTVAIDVRARFIWVPQARVARTTSEVIWSRSVEDSPRAISTTPS